MAPPVFVRSVTLAVSIVSLGAGGGLAGPRPELTIAAVGDIAMAPAAEGGKAFFSVGVRRALAAHLALGNLEGTLATRGVSRCRSGEPRCYSFRAPPGYARRLRQAGLHVLSLANNHALDYGQAGRDETIAALRRAGLRHVGLPGQIAYADVGAVTVAVLAVAPYPWAQDLRDIAGAVALVRRASAHADLVVVSVHAGAEGAEHRHVRPGQEWFLGESRGNPLALAHAVVRAGADLVVGHGPHVLRGMEWYRGRLIAYSLGNFLGNGTLSIAGPAGMSAVLRVTLRPDGSWVRGTLVPVRLVPPGLPRLDNGKSVHTAVRTLSRQDFGRDAVRVTARGRLLPPAWRTG